MTHPSAEEFARLARSYPIVPVHRELLADLATPVSVFRRLDPGREAALLESVEGGETWGRFSVIGLDGGTRFESRGGIARIREGDRERTVPDDPPLSALDELLEQHRTAGADRLPRLAGAAIGFASYDLIRRFEKLPDTAHDDLDMPDALFVFFETVILFDHARHCAILVSNARPGGDPAAAYAQAQARLDRLEAFLSEPPPRTTRTPRGGEVTFRSRTGKEAFLHGVDRIKEYIRAGDVVQVVLSHRLEARLEADPFDVYRALRVINPSPYMFFLRLGGWAVAGSSPEVLVRRERDLVQTRPIAGTRGRSPDAGEDARLEEDLRHDEKERAEHIMLVDLGRNDLGRICRYGTVETNELMAVERYSHVMHLVSNVRGRLETEVPNSSVLRACFPAGTVSGAPKIRAMEIIEELEPLRRGLYAGAVGYMDYHGNMDTAIAIRTLLFRDRTVHLGVGAGIVADSDPEEEWRETKRKAGALVRACQVAAGGLVDIRPPRGEEELPILEDEEGERA
ncbi:MAG: anthranilate synthase component I [Candidatus Latescibacteria bacterium]|nr:anthranilate synthase component I [Candidatus Latescibacterota bacterium]